MPRFLRVALVTALALSLVAAAGCGGDTKKSNDYVKAINKAQTEFAASVSKLQSGASSAQGVAATFATLKAAIEKVVSDLKAVNPPDKVKDLHNRLVAEMTQLDKAVTDAADAVASKDPKKILAAQSSFATGVSQLGPKVTDTIAAINKKLQG